MNRFLRGCVMVAGTVMLTGRQKIRTIELDGKTVKLQIVRLPFATLENPALDVP